MAVDMLVAEAVMPSLVAEHAASRVEHVASRVEHAASPVAVAMSGAAVAIIVAAEVTIAEAASTAADSMADRLCRLVSTGPLMLTATPILTTMILATR